MSTLVIFVIAIIILQVCLYIKTSWLISKLKRVLSGDFSTGQTVDDDVTVIRYKAKNKDDVSQNIELSINTYLKKNKGAVSDFNLIKDIVERNCDTLEAEISSQTPLPLYLGLMGTVAGIILGLLTITLNGGFSNIENVIDTLMSDVAIAMVASFMGIGLTTLTLWKAKKCKVKVEANKNRFYTWIQTNLLPVISKSAVSAITLLQHNLTRFNESFVGTVNRLEAKLGDVGDVYESQIEILNKIEAIDVKKMATANVKVLSALDGSMGSLDRFSQYMGNVTEYLIAVRELNNKLDEHLERTETLGVVSEFYKKQMKEIELRQDAIKSAVVSVDDVMKSALASLQSNSENGLKSMQEAFMGQMMTMQEMISKQTEKLAAQMNMMPQIVKNLEDISTIPSKLNKLIDRIEKSNSGLAKQVSQTLRTVPANSSTKIISGEVSFPQDTVNPSKNSLMKWIIIVILSVIALACIANLSVNIINMNASQNEVAVVDSLEIASDKAIPDEIVEMPSKNIKYDTVVKQPTISPQMEDTNKDNDKKPKIDEPIQKKEGIQGPKKDNLNSNAKSAGGRKSSDERW